MAKPVPWYCLSHMECASPWVLWICSLQWARQPHIQACFAQMCMRGLFSSSTSVIAQSSWELLMSRNLFWQSFPSQIQIRFGINVLPVFPCDIAEGFLSVRSLVCSHECLGKACQFYLFGIPHVRLLGHLMRIQPWYPLAGWVSLTHELVRRDQVESFSALFPTDWFWMQKLPVHS